MVSHKDVGDYVLSPKIFLVERHQFMTWKPIRFASVLFILMLLDCAQWAILFIHLDLSSFSPSHLMAQILREWMETFEPLNLLQKPFKHAECCIWSRRDEGKKVTGFGLFEHRNTSEVIYAPVLTRRWVMDFHAGLEKAAACSEVTDS